MKPIRFRKVIVRRKRYTDRSLRKGITGKIILKLKAVSPIHVGTGTKRYHPDEKTVNAASKLDFKDLVRMFREGKLDFGEEIQETCRCRGVPCIPGSTMKGLVRSFIELSMTGGKGEVCSCFSKASYYVESGLRGTRHYRVWGETVLEDRGYPCNPATTGDYSLCVTCDLLGAPGVASRVMFGDMVADKTASTALMKISVVNGTTLIEAIPENTLLAGEIVFDSITVSELGLVLAGLGARPDGGFNRILVGRFKYRPVTLLWSSEKGVVNQRVRMGRARVESLEFRVLDSRGEELIKQGCYKDEQARRIVAESVKHALQEYPCLRILDVAKSADMLE